MAPATLPRAPIIRKRPDNLHDWTEQQVTQATREDQHRPTDAASLKTIAHYARLDDVREGYAVCTPDRLVFFLDGTTVTALTDTDIPRLTLLGRVDLVEVQERLDQAVGTCAHIATSRNN